MDELEDTLPSGPEQTPAGPDPRVGKVLGGAYRLVERIGEGGMGVVYAARHETLGRSFAVKLLSTHRPPNASTFERFKQEAVRASQLEHDHIVDVVHFDQTDDGEMFLVMELLRGESLAARLVRGGAMTLGDALRIVHQVADALEAAHDHGLVHRDLKPENVFLTTKRGVDFAKVLDFGVAKFRDPEGAGDDGGVTGTGAILGTPMYMSPEQARGETDRVDRRADVYALGAILYEMLAGSPPFRGANHYQLLWKHGQEDPEPPRARNPDLVIPDDVEAAVLHALTKDPDARYPTMRAFADALPPPPEAPLGASRSSLPSPTAPATPVPTPPYGPRRFFRELGIIALVGVALVAAATLVGRARGPSAEAPDPAPPPEAREPAAPPADPAPAVVDRVPVRFESRPRGAEVRLGDEVLGHTPLVAPVPRSETPLPVRFVLEGYEEAVVRVVPVTGARVDATLVRPPRPRPSKSPPPEPAPLPFKKRF